MATSRRPLRPFVLYAAFIASGACGLTYQVLWARWLSLMLGNTTASVSIVLSSFMLGLALGGAIGGRKSGSVRSPLAAYGVCEIAIGVFALAFPLLSNVFDRGLGLVLQADSAPVTGLTLRAIVAFLLLVIPTTLMGATLPFVTEHFRRHPDQERGWKLGTLYAANTAGAALGTLAISFVFIELAGVSASNVMAAVLNLLVGAWALWAGRAAVEKRRQPQQPETPPVHSRLPLFILAASGAVALASEVLWTRALEILVGNSTYAFALMLVVYLTGIAAGSAVSARLVRRLKSLGAWLAGSQLAMTAATFVAIGAFNVVAAALRSRVGSPVQPEDEVLLYLQAAAILFPLAFFSGAVFPIATRMLAGGDQEASGALAGRAYAWNTIGSVIGALAGGFLLAPNLDFLQAPYALAAMYGAVALGCAIPLYVRRDPAERRSALAALGALSAVAIGLGVARIGQHPGFPAHIQNVFPGSEVPFHRTGVQATTTVVRMRPGDRMSSLLLVNGSGMTVLTTITKMMAHIPLLLHPKPQKVLVICFGMGTTYRSALSHGVEVTAVELVPEVFDAFDQFHADAAQLKAHPRGRLIANDGRNFLKLTDERFDVITIDPPPPIDGAGVNHLHSRDFVRLARERLNPGGILAHWIPTPAADAGVDDWDTFYMLIRSVVDEFPHAAIVPAAPEVGVHVLVSDQPFSTPPEVVYQRLETPSIAADVNEWRSFHPPYPLGLQDVNRADLTKYAPVTDDEPRLEFDLLRELRSDRRRNLRQVWW